MLREHEHPAVGRKPTQCIGILTRGQMVGSRSPLDFRSNSRKGATESTECAQHSLRGNRKYVRIPASKPHTPLASLKGHSETNHGTLAARRLASTTAALDPYALWSTQRSLNHGKDV